jgi:CDP-diglyceride synthetase
MFFNNLLNILNTLVTEISLTYFYLDVILLQFIIFYTFYLLYSASNIYYVLVYLFLQILYFGLILSLLQLELFTGFLWVTELTILFIFLILCFYLNAEGTFNFSNKKVTNFFFFFFFLICFFFFKFGFN